MAVNSAYAKKMDSYAARAAVALNMPKEVIIVQWALESGNGTSSMAVNHNNHGGIKWSKYSKTAKQRSDSAFASYNSIGDFVTDYIRVMNLSYYDGVRAAGTVEATVKALGSSPYDAGHYMSNGVAGAKLMNLLGVSVVSAGEAPALSNAVKKEIERKAKEGIALSSPTAEAQAYYAQVQSGKSHPSICPACHRAL